MELFEYIDVLNKPYEIYLENIQYSPFSVAKHWHYYGEILYGIQGEIRVKCEDKDFVLRPTDLLFVAPQSVHEIEMKSKAPIQYAVLKFDVNGLRIPGVYYQKLLEFVEQVSRERAHMFTGDELQKTPVDWMIRYCLKEQDGGGFACEYVSQASLGTVLVQLCRIYPFAQEESTSIDRKKTRYYFYDALTYIDHNYAKNIKVEDLAKKSGMSYSNFAKLFKKQFGRSCKEYLEYVRVNKAEELVLYSDMDMSYIAQETGFADCSHMIRTYKKFKNETPKQARMRGAKKDEN